MKIKTELFQTSKELNIASKEVLQTEDERTKAASLAKTLVGYSLVVVKLSTKNDGMKDVKFTIEYNQEYGVPLVKLA